MPEDKKPKKDEEVKDAMASMSSSEHSMSLPRKDKSKKVWIVLFWSGDNSNIRVL